jgi:hypothetical protein
LIVKALVTVFSLAALVCNLHAQTPDEGPSHALRTLSERADLIIDATITEDISGGMSGGPIPRAGQWNIGCLSCCPTVRVNRVLKGEAKEDSLLFIAVTVPLASFGEAKEVPLNVPIFSTGGSDPIEEPLFAKGQRAIFFLEDRPKREPGSVHTKGGEEVRYRTFDFWLGKLPFSEALAQQIILWQKR